MNNSFSRRTLTALQNYEIAIKLTAYRGSYAVIGHSALYHLYRPTGSQALYAEARRLEMRCTEILGIADKHTLVEPIQRVVLEISYQGEHLAGFTTGAITPHSSRHPKGKGRHKLINFAHKALSNLLDQIDSESNQRSVSKCA